MNNALATAIIVVGIALSMAIGVSVYHHSISQIKDPVSLCFATANGEKEMNICLKLKEMSDDR